MLQVAGAILGEFGIATAVSLVGTYHRPGMRWDTALEHLLVVPPGNDSLGIAPVKYRSQELTADRTLVLE